MPTSFFQYEMLPTTWFYVSALIILAIFFKFNRFWSVRNLDLIGLVLTTPGLLILALHDNQWGFVWLFGIGLLMVVRLFFDTLMVRRPLLEPNLTPGGLTFSCFFTICFVIAALTVNRGDQIDTVRTVRLEQILTTRHIEKQIGMAPVTLTIPEGELNNLPPGFRPFLALSERTNLALAPPPRIREEILQSMRQEETDSKTPTQITSDVLTERPTGVIVDPNRSATSPVVLTIPSTTLLSESNMPISVATKPDDLSDREKETIPSPSLTLLFLIMTIAIFAHLMIVFGFIYIGHCHFGNIRTGIACATLYLLLPYTNQVVGRLDHLIPAALILWGVAMYRKPFFSGLWIGTAAALVFYPICLVPLWCSFYWRRGWIRFLIGFATAIVVFAVFLVLSPASLGSYGDQLLHLLGKSSLFIFSRPDGFWEYHDMMYRVPLLAVYFALCFGMILWPTHKHLATLLSCSTLLMLGVQFWQIHQGGLYMAWYLPLLILTIFRPNLEDRVALSTVVP